MPATRSSQQEKEQNDNGELEEISVRDVSSGRRAKTSESRASSRELRRKRREALKSRNTGVGLSISTKATSNKIVFDGDDEEEEDTGMASAHATGMPDTNDDGSDQRDDDREDDDDAIEEVKSSVARDKAIERLAKEREIAKERKLQTRTKKRKKTVPVAAQEEEDFDEDFFAQVDVEMAEQRKQKKLKESAPSGRHTAFLSMVEDVDSRPIQADHNIELVVLDDSALESDQRNRASAKQVSGEETGIEQSEASHLFARDRLASGKDQAKRKGNKKKDDSGWTRSKKMNALAFGRPKAIRRKGRGRAAPIFAVRK